VTRKIYSLEQAGARFDSSQDFTVGIEEEFQILDRETHALTDRFEELMEIARGRIATFARGELIGSEIEICTDRCRDMADAEADLRGKRHGLYESAAQLGVTVGASGTHPFSDWQDQRIIDTPHYQAVESDLRYVAWRNVTFGMHTHVGVRGRERIIAVCNAMRGYLPYLLALSANSPFAGGRYTYLHSSRSQFFTKFFPRCNIPGPFRDWAEYAELVETLFAVGSITEPTQIWWSVRPHPVMSTLEIRICDCQSSIDDTLAIAALTVALVARLCADYDAGRALPVLSSNQVEENFWRAIRFGLDGALVDFGEKKEVPAPEALRRLIEYTRPVHGPLALEKYMAGVERILVEGNGAQRQIRLYEKTGDISTVFEEVVKWSQPGRSLTGEKPGG
jgi:carboxylate-amine ligase